MSLVRRTAVLCVAGLILLAAASVPAFAAPPAAVRCASSCGQDASVGKTGARAPAESCIHDAGCGGGGSLSGSSNMLVAAFAVGASVVVCALAIRRHRGGRIPQPLGSLLASRLFRPPRLLLGH